MTTAQQSMRLVTECDCILYPSGKVSNYNLLCLGKRGFENMSGMDLTNIVGPILTGSFEVSQLEC